MVLMSSVCHLLLLTWETSACSLYQPRRMQSSLVCIKDFRPPSLLVVGEADQSLPLAVNSCRELECAQPGLTEVESNDSGRIRSVSL
jgi:hypothetical protein